MDEEGKGGNMSFSQPRGPRTTLRGWPKNYQGIGKAAPLRYMYEN